nr:PREDICTED: 5-hydroxytryptamine receptor 6 [Struthio camelus australis]
MEVMILSPLGCGFETCFIQSSQNTLASALRGYQQNNVKVCFGKKGKEKEGRKERKKDEKGKEKGAAAGGEGRRLANKHSKKVLKASLTLGILLGMFFVAWLPFFVANVTQRVSAERTATLTATLRQCEATFSPPNPSALFLPPSIPPLLAGATSSSPAESCEAPPRCSHVLIRARNAEATSFY